MGALLLDEAERPGRRDVFQIAPIGKLDLKSFGCQSADAENQWR